MIVYKCGRENELLKVLANESNTSISEAVPNFPKENYCSGKNVYTACIGIKEKKQD